MIRAIPSYYLIEKKLEIVLNLAHLLLASGFLATHSCDSSYENGLLMLHSLSLQSLVANQSLEQELDARSCNEKGLVKTVLTFSTAAWQHHATNLNMSEPKLSLSHVRDQKTFAGVGPHKQRKISYCNHDPACNGSNDSSKHIVSPTMDV